MLWGVSITKLANAVIKLRRAGLDEKYEMLFDAWDYNADGTVEFMDIDKGLKKLKASSDEIHVEIVSEAAFKALPTVDNPHTLRFDKASFRGFAERLTLEMGQPFSIVSELLILGALEVQPRQDSETSFIKEIQGKVDEQVRKAEQNKLLSQDPAITKLFECFNTSGSGRLSFTEVAHMLRKLRLDVSLREARAEAVNLMLLLDTESERSLGPVEFSRFIQKMSVLLCLEPHDLAVTLQDISQCDTPNTLDDSATALMMENSGPISQVFETIADRKMHLLFDMWDKDADGSISFAELTLGLRKLSPATESASDTASDAAEVLLDFDSDSDQRLDWADFARFINHFCEGCGTDFSTLSEYLILLAALEDNPTEELAFLLSEDKVERAIVELDNTWRNSVTGRGDLAKRKGSDQPTPSDTTIQQSGDLSSPKSQPNPVKFADKQMSPEAGTQHSVPQSSEPKSQANNLQAPEQQQLKSRSPGLRTLRSMNSMRQAPTHTDDGNAARGQASVSDSPFGAFPVKSPPESKEGSVNERAQTVATNQALTPFSRSSEQLKISESGNFGMGLASKRSGIPSGSAIPEEDSGPQKVSMTYTSSDPQQSNHQDPSSDNRKLESTTSISQ